MSSLQVFFRVGILAKLEDVRDERLAKIMITCRVGSGVSS